MGLTHLRNRIACTHDTVPSRHNSRELSDASNPTSIPSRRSPVDVRDVPLPIVPSINTCFSSCTYRRRATERRRSVHHRVGRGGLQKTFPGYYRRVNACNCRVFHHGAFTLRGWGIGEGMGCEGSLHYLAYLLTKIHLSPETCKHIRLLGNICMPVSRQHRESLPRQYKR